MSPTPTRLIGGRYQITRKIAEGGMGEVFEARHNLSKKKVALKILFPHIGKDEAARQRFLREVSAPAQIGHDGIVEVYDAGFDTQDGSLFVAMEFVDGEPLRDRLARGNVPLDQLLDWFEEILDPLAAAHEAGIVHRDLKPENVMLAKQRNGDEVIKVLDFGIARDLDESDNNVTQTGIAMGTPHYMAPEQAMSAKGVTPAADVWALGVMLYEALLGRPPFEGETASAIVVHACTQAHTSLSQLAPHVPAPLSAFVDRLLAKEPLGRPQTARAMLEELRQVRAQIGGAHGQVMPVQGSAVATGPMAGMTPPPTGAPARAPTGTALLPATGTPAPHGTPPPGGAFHTPPPGGAFGTAPPGGAFGTAPPGGAFGSRPPGTPPPTAGGYGTPPPGSFGSSGGIGNSPPGFGTPAPSHAFGTNPSPAGGPGFATGAPAGFAPQKKKGGGLALGIIAGVLALGLLVVGGGILIAAVALSSGDDEDQPAWSSTGNVTLRTDVPAGVLTVDGSSRGMVANGQTLRIRPGAHAFQLREGGAVVASGTLTVSAGQEHTLTLNRTAAPPQNRGLQNQGLPPNAQTFRGELRPGDSQDPSGKFFDTYSFNWTAGTRVVVLLDSADLDTYLTVRSPSGIEQTNDDRPGGGLNSGLDLSLRESGVFTVECSTFSPNSTGDYTLTVHGP